MNQSANQNDGKAIWTLSALGGIVGGFCCLTPIVMVMFGLAGVSFAADLGDVLYGEYRWAFRSVGLALTAGGLVVYFRKRGVCTFDEAKRQRNRILNVSILALTAATGVYTLWTYVILHYWGIWAGLPWAQYDESWAIPWSIGILALAAGMAYRLRRRLGFASAEEQVADESGRRAEWDDARPELQSGD